MSDALIDVRDLKVYFSKPGAGLFTSSNTIKAVDGLSFQVASGEVLSLVGESGCGKSTLAKQLLRLETKTAGQIQVQGQAIESLTTSELQSQIQMIFQDPYASLNPRLTIEQTLREPLMIHKLAANRKAARDRVVDMLEEVGLDATILSRYPHEFSGGQRQRIGIARVMIVKPKLIIADEAVSALDVSIQAQVLNLLKRLQRESGVAMLFISHDLAVVRHISDRIAVMREGRIVELTSKSALFEQPEHEFTQRLLKAIPRIPVIRGVA